MVHKNVTIIPPTNTERRDPHMGTPGKTHVVGYGRVLKGTGAGVQIRKNIRRTIADYPDWELTYVQTDYCGTENQEPTWRTFISLCHSIKNGRFDVLIVYAEDDLDDAMNTARMLAHYCKEYGVVLHMFVIKLEILWMIRLLQLYNNQSPLPHSQQLMTSFESYVVRI